MISWLVSKIPLGLQRIIRQRVQPLFTAKDRERILGDVNKTRQSREQFEDFQAKPGKEHTRVTFGHTGPDILKRTGAEFHKVACGMSDGQRLLLMERPPLTVIDLEVEKGKPRSWVEEDASVLVDLGGIEEEFDVDLSSVMKDERLRVCFMERSGDSIFVSLVSGRSDYGRAKQIRTGTVPLADCLEYSPPEM